MSSLFVKVGNVDPFLKTSFCVSVFDTVSDDVEVVYYGVKMSVCPSAVEDGKGHRPTLIHSLKTDHLSSPFPIHGTDRVESD